MNRPFAEMGYNSSGLNIAPKRLLLATRRPFTHHPSTLCAPPANAPQTICNTRHNIWRPPQAICRRSAQHLAVPCTASAISLRAIPLAPAQHPSALCKPSARQFTARCPATPCKPSAIARHSIRHLAARHPLAPCRQSVDTNRRPNGPQNKPSAQAGALNPRKSMFCVIDNCPLQIKPVFYFLFTSIASPTHRIRVKLSLLRLGRSCLALPFTHLGKDIT